MSESEDFIKTAEGKMLPIDVQLSLERRKRGN